MLACGPYDLALLGDGGGSSLGRRVATAVLKPHSELLVERLMTNGVRADTVVFPADHQPPLGHEYQFDLDTGAGRLFLERMLAFLAQHLGAGTTPRPATGSDPS